MSTAARPISTMAASASSNEVKSAITEYLRSKNMPPTKAWLQNFMPSIRLNTPIVALQKTALFRLLSTDLTTCVQATPNSVFPSGTSSPEVKEKRLPGPIAVQVLDIEDVGHSRWSQVESLEAQERGETTKGQEIVRVVPDENSSDPNHAPETASSSGSHKLLLQDANGTKLYGFELESVNGFGVQMSMGSKLMLRDVAVSRGVILLNPKSVDLLGGKVDVWDKQWRSERTEVLKRKAGLDNGG